VGVEHGGPDKGTETGDKPTKPDNNGGPPPDNPRSAAQPSRVESLRAAGWNVNGQQETGTKENGEGGQKGNESTSTDSTGESASADPTEAEKEPGTGKAESGTDSETGREGKNDGPKPGTGEAAPPDEGKREPRTTEIGEQPPKTDTESRSTDERNGEAVKDPEPPGGNDNRTKPGDKTSTHDAGRPAPDESESSKPMTRRESLENAGWNSPEKPDQNTGSQDSQGEPSGDGKSLTDAGGPKSGEVAPQDKPASPVPEGDNARTDEISTPNAPVGEQNAGKPPTDERGPASDETGPQGEHGGEGHAQDGGIPAGDATGTGTTADGENPPVQAPEGKADEGTPEVKPLQEAEAKPLPQQDGPKPDASDEPPTPEPNGEGADKPADGDGGEPHTEPVGETTDQSTAPGAPESGRNPAEQPGNKPENRPDSEQPADQRSTDDTPSSPEEAGDRGRNAEETELTEPADEGDPPDHDPAQSGETEEPSSELAPHDENPPEVEPNPYRARITLRRDRDGNFISERRFEVEADAPGRGEPRNPEEDPADRNPLAPDPERPRSPKDLRREMIRASAELNDAVNETAKPAFKQFDSRPPKTQPCLARNSDHIKSPDQSVKGGDVMVGVVGGVIVFTELVRLSIGLTRKATGREHAGNR
jgi:hypothetical protein